MNKAIIFFAGVLLIGIHATWAQTDTTFNRTKGDTLRLAPIPQPQATTPARQRNEYSQEDRVLVQPELLPVHLRETLQSNQYKGWENSSIYQDRLTGEYSLEITNGSDTPRAYRFDKNGKLIGDPNKPREKLKE